LAIVAVAGWAIAIVFLNKSEDLGGKLETSEAVRAKLSEDLESARKDVAKYLESAGRLDEIGQQVSAAEDQVAALDGQLQAARQELAAVRNETEAGKAEFATLESKLRERKAQVSEIEQEIELAGTELERLRAESEELRRKAERAQTGLSVERQPQAASEAEPRVAEPKEADRIAEARRRFQVVDRNGDGKLEQFEFRLSSVKLMGLIDANKDGFITRDETLLSPEQFALFDLDGDGKISAIEFVDARTFRTIDTKKQGFITFEEYLAFNQATVK
jgi:myosin heavy subunit